MLLRRGSVISAGAGAQGYYLHELPRSIDYCQPDRVLTLINISYFMKLEMK